MQENLSLEDHEAFRLTSGNYSALHCGSHSFHALRVKPWHIEQEARKAGLQEALRGRFRAGLIARFLEANYRYDERPEILVRDYFTDDAPEAGEIFLALRDDCNNRIKTPRQLSRVQTVLVYVGPLICDGPLVYFGYDGVTKISLVFGAGNELANILGLTVGAPSGLLAAASQLPFIFNGLKEQTLRQNAPYQIELVKDVQSRYHTLPFKTLRVLFSIQSAFGAAIYMDKLLVTISQFLMENPDRQLTVGEIVAFDCLKLGCMFGSLYFSTVNNDDHIRHAFGIIRYFFQTTLNRYNHWLTQFNHQQKVAFHEFLGTRPLNSMADLHDIYAEVKRVKETENSGITDRSLLQLLILFLAAIAMIFASRAQYWSVGFYQIEWSTKVLVDPNHSFLDVKEFQNAA